MKTSAIVRIVVLFLIAVVLTGILIAGIVFQKFTGGSANSSDRHHNATADASGHVQSNSVIAADSVKTIQINWASGTVAVEAGDFQDIIISESYADGAVPMSWVQNGSAIEINYSETSSWKSLIGTVQSSKLLTVQVPRDWDCKALSIHVASADIQVSGLTAQKVTIESASSNANFQDCRVENMKCSSASGDLYYTGILDEFNADGASVNAVLELHNIPDSIQLDSMSGSLNVMLPADCGFTAKCGSLSGRITTEFATQKQDNAHIFGNGSCRIEVDGLSASATIRKGAYNAE